MTSSKEEDIGHGYGVQEAISQALRPPPGLVGICSYVNSCCQFTHKSRRVRLLSMRSASRENTYDGTEIAVPAALWHHTINLRGNVHDEADADAFTPLLPPVLAN